MPRESWCQKGLWYVKLEISWRISWWGTFSPVVFNILCEPLCTSNDLVFNKLLYGAMQHLNHVMELEIKLRVIYTWKYVTEYLIYTIKSSYNMLRSSFWNASIWPWLQIWTIEDGMKFRWFCWISTHGACLDQNNDFSWLKKGDTAPNHIKKIRRTIHACVV